MRSFLPEETKALLCEFDMLVLTDGVSLLKTTKRRSRSIPTNTSTRIL